MTWAAAAPPADALNRKVTVCAQCLTASCWRGIFPCDNSRDADITTRTVAELRALGYEHADHYRVDPNYPEPER